MWRVLGAMIGVGTITLLSLCGCRPTTETFEQVNYPPEQLGLPMNHLKVETQKVEPSIGEVEM